MVTKVFEGKQENNGHTIIREYKSKSKIKITFYKLNSIIIYIIMNYYYLWHNIYITLHVLYRYKNNIQ